jgi:hypothetical protein
MTSCRYIPKDLAIALCKLIDVEMVVSSLRRYFRSGQMAQQSLDKRIQTVMCSHDSALVSLRICDVFLGVFYDSVYLLQNLLRQMWPGFNDILRYSLCPCLRCRGRTGWVCVETATESSSVSSSLCGFFLGFAFLPFVALAVGFATRVVVAPLLRLPGGLPLRFFPPLSFTRGRANKSSAYFALSEGGSTYHDVVWEPLDAFAVVYHCEA